MSRRKTRCLAAIPTGGAPWSPWRTVCGRVLDEMDVSLLMDWPLDQPSRPSTICRSCWSRMRPWASFLSPVEVSVGEVPRYTGPTFQTIPETNPHRRRREPS